jgi:hypothetical protein
MISNPTRTTIDMRKTTFYFILAVALVLVLVPIMIFIHEMGHVIAILLLGGKVTGLHLSWFSGYVTFSGLEGTTELFLVHLSGVTATMIVGAGLIFHVWRYEGHPFVEALSLVWGIFLFLLDFLNYTIYDIFGDRDGDFDKIYEVYPWSVPVFILLDVLLVIIVIVLLTRREFWQGIQLPRKAV